ncbi:unnamed protein product [Schistosoma mattheei]|uniref:Uncharacterized protein n=1 Tax=Schistosoma mattheei TaxID=31246 RepID=A0A3P8BB13_9TREM|nr:unnamed protein product [Schistosoma mattheei]
MVRNQSFSTPLGGLSVSTNPFKVPDIRFSSSQFRKQHPYREKAMSRTSLAEAIYAWPCESISRGRTDSPHSRPCQGIKYLNKNMNNNPKKARNVPTFSALVPFQR